MNNILASIVTDESKEKARRKDSPVKLGKMLASSHSVSESNEPLKLEMAKISMDTPILHDKPFNRFSELSSDVYRAPILRCIGGRNTLKDAQLQVMHEAVEEEITTDEVAAANALIEDRPAKSTMISMDNTMIPDELWSRKTSTVMFVGPDDSANIHSDNSPYNASHLPSSRFLSFEVNNLPCEIPNEISTLRSHMVESESERRINKIRGTRDNKITQVFHKSGPSLVVNLQTCALEEP